MQREKSHTIFFTFYCLCKTKIRENCHESQTQGCVLSLFHQYLMCANLPGTKSTFLCTNENRTDSPQYFSAKICSQTSLPPYRVQALEAIVIMISVDDTTSSIYDLISLHSAKLSTASSYAQRSWGQNCWWYHLLEKERWSFLDHMKMTSGSTLHLYKKIDKTTRKKASGSMYCSSRENGRVIFCCIMKWKPDASNRHCST